MERNNDGEEQLQASTNNVIQSDSLDCGFKALGWCSGEWCQKLATKTSFIIIFAIVGILQGAVGTYFRISAQQAAIELGFDSNALSWLLASVGIVQCLLVIALVFYSQRFHPMSWVSGFIFMEAALCLISIIPSLHALPTEKQNQLEYGPPLCDVHSYPEQEEKPHSIVTLVLLFGLQAVISLTGGITYCIGYTYMDDNTRAKDFTILAAIALGTHVWGAQVGAGISLLVESVNIGWWLGWAILVPLLAISATLIGLFPRKLTKTVVRQGADLILQRFSYPNLIEARTAYVQEFTFLPSMKRLLTNKILMFNLMAAVFAQTAIINYFMQEENYMQSRFYLPTNESNGLLDEWLSRFMMIIIKPPVVGLAILMAGFIISKLSPSGKRLAVWNVVACVLIALFFFSYIFIHCTSGDIASSYKNKVRQPRCSSDCLCGEDTLFTPVCPAGSKKTYFSPCHAGCKFTKKLNNIVIFENCTCGAHPEIPVFEGIATEGACNSGECQVYWLIYQFLTLLAATLFGSCFVGRMLITFRSVLLQDKALALALELTFVGFIANVPGKLIFDWIASATCQYWSSDTKVCYLHSSPLHGNILNIVCGCLFIVAAIFDILVVVFAKDLNCFPKHISKPDASQITMQTTISTGNTSNHNAASSDRNDAVAPAEVVPLLRNQIDSSSESTLLQHSPRRFSSGGRRSQSPVTTDPHKVIYSDIKSNKSDDDEVLREPRRISNPQEQNLNYAQVMVEFKRRKSGLSSKDLLREEPSTSAAAAIVSDEGEENLDFSLQQPLSQRQDIDADDELSELDSSRRQRKGIGKETSF